jgi:quercetin dioxygenase-like cupin family protein
MPDDNQKPPISVDYFEDLTGEIEETSETICDQIGDRIAQVRTAKGLSIAELSHLTGFDEQMLEQIEANTLCPQLGTVIKLSKALDSALQRLISGEGRVNYTVTRQDQRKVISRSTTQRGQREAYTYMGLAPEVKGRHMEPLIVDLKQIPESERSSHAGEEFIYVLEGMVSLEIEDKQFELRPGDSAYYQSSLPHLLNALGGGARILAVIYSE